MINKFFTSLLITLMITSHAYSAGSSDSSSSKTKTQYDMAVTHIKAAKNLEEKGKLDKAKQKYEKTDKKKIIEKWITEPSEIIQRPWSGKGYPGEDNFISLNGMLNNINNKKFREEYYIFKGE